MIGREADHDDSKGQALGIPRLVFASAIQFNKCFKFVLDNSVHVIRYDGFANVGGEGGGDETVLGDLQLWGRSFPRKRLRQTEPT